MNCHALVQWDTPSRSEFGKSRFVSNSGNQSPDFSYFQKRQLFRDEPVNANLLRKVSKSSSSDTPSSMFICLHRYFDLTNYQIKPKVLFGSVQSVEVHANDAIRVLARDTRAIAMMFVCLRTRDGVWMCKLSVISQEQFKIELVTIEC